MGTDSTAWIWIVCCGYRESEVGPERLVRIQIHTYRMGTESLLWIKIVWCGFRESGVDSESQVCVQIRNVRTYTGRLVMWSLH